MSALLPHDPALPQLAQSLDPQAMAKVFARALSGMQVRSCEVDRIKYRPGRNCSVSYVLRLHDPQRGRDVEQRVAARFCSAGDSARRHLKSIASATQASAAGPALLHLPALDMLAHWWPNDAKLDAPALLHDDERMRVHCVDKVIAALTGGRGRWVGHRTSIVQQVPELRVCARVELRLQAEPGASITSQREPAVTLRGDLHPRNILVDGQQLAFVDLDSVCSGPALIELGARAANLKPGRFEAVPALLALAESIARAGSVDAAMACETEPA